MERVKWSVNNFFFYMINKEYKGKQRIIARMVRRKDKTQGMDLIHILIWINILI